MGTIVGDGINRRAVPSRIAVRARHTAVQFLLIALLLLAVCPDSAIAAAPYLPPGGTIETWEQVVHQVAKLAEAYLGAAMGPEEKCGAEANPFPFCAVPRPVAGAICTYWTVYACMRQWIWTVVNVGLVSCDFMATVLNGRLALDCETLQHEWKPFTGRYCEPLSPAQRLEAVMGQ